MFPMLKQTLLTLYKKTTIVRTFLKCFTRYQGKSKNNSLRVYGFLIYDEYEQFLHRLTFGMLIIYFKILVKLYM